MHGLIISSLLKISFGIYKVTKAIKDYDAVILCGPIWMGQFIFPLHDFLKKYGKDIKKLYFASCCGSGPDTSGSYNRLMDFIGGTMDDEILKTHRLVLRHQRKSDIKFLVHLWMDEDMTKYTGGPRNKMNLIEEFRKIAEDPKKEEFDLWSIEIKNTHELIGQAGFLPKEIKGKKYIELNFYIDKIKWGKGYAKEISTALLDYAFNIKMLDKIIAIIDPENEASKVVAKSIGLKYWMNAERSGNIKSVYMIRKEEAL